VQLAHARSPSYALDVLGRCQRERPCDSATVNGGGLAQALHLVNGSTVNDRLPRSDSVRRVADGWTDRAIVEELYLRAFTRRPEAAELAEWQRLLSTAEDKKIAVEDLLWTVLNSREFAFNH
jgi:hypothetical protein